ncbi:hypothetical protein P106B_47 [Rhizobium phage vB_RglS_P106B]|uniref:Uncharacterized protein n=1 Tax=Rhizobium phage vB_RglS_P106B TaxID=1458697 RepID=W6E8G9_9CAUD|nr:hypothetical protein P106B_47 [Rhizobium phage vB_RglS_P106B]AHJ10730.1 hypothetical protein P106B_47 [Rhizobium phage vB_RglS_P106B]
MANTDELREKIKDACKGADMGLVVAALAQVSRLLFLEIDTNAPHLSERARKDFEKHLNGPEHTEH